MKNLSSVGRDKLIATIERQEAVLRLVRRAHEVGALVLDEGDDPSLAIPAVSRADSAEAEVKRLRVALAALVEELRERWGESGPVQFTPLLKAAEKLLKVPSNG